MAEVFSHEETSGRVNESRISSKEFDDRSAAKKWARAQISKTINENPGKFLRAK